jgi:hypothetical protein
VEIEVSRKLAFSILDREPPLCGRRETPAALGTTRLYVTHVYLLPTITDTTATFWWWQ